MKMKTGLKLANAMNNLKYNLLFYRINIILLFMVSIVNFFEDSAKYVLAGMTFMLILIMMFDINDLYKKIK